MIEQSNISNTLETRGTTHGDFKWQCAITHKLKGTIGWGETGTLKDYQIEALDMIAVKIGRILAGNCMEPDHWHDIAGYATLVEKECLKENQT